MMKVIGKASDNNYLCEVSHTELEKFYEKYYGNLNTLKVGDVLDLGAGYDFRDAITGVSRKTTDAIEAFQKHLPLLTQFIALVGSLPPTPKPTDKDVT